MSPAPPEDLSRHPVPQPGKVHPRDDRERALAGIPGPRLPRAGRRARRTGRSRCCANTRDACRSCPRRMPGRPTPSTRASRARRARCSAISTATTSCARARSRPSARPSRPIPTWCSCGGAPPTSTRPGERCPVSREAGRDRAPRGRVLRRPARGVFPAEGVGGDRALRHRAPPHDGLRLLAADRGALSGVAHALPRPRAGGLPHARGREDRRGLGPRARRDHGSREDAVRVTFRSGGASRSGTTASTAAARRRTRTPCRGGRIRRRSSSSCEETRVRGRGGEARGATRARRRYGRISGRRGRRLCLLLGCLSGARAMEGTGRCGGRRPPMPVAGAHGDWPSLAR